MQIRAKLTLQFLAIVIVILTAASLAIYFFSAEYRENEFYDRLEKKANTIAKLLLEVEEIDADLLKLIEEYNLGTLPQEKIIIYNFKNEVLYSTDDNHDLEISDKLLDQIRLEDQIIFKQGELEALGTLYKGEYDRFAVIAAAQDRFGFSKLNNLRNVLLVVFGVSLFIAAFSAWIYAGRALKPISNIVTQAEKISATNLSSRLDEGNKTDEIAQLAATFNKMLARIESSFKVQRSFVANASHELRTPLTAITGQIEVVLLKEREREVYELALKSVLEDIKNMNKLSNRLLVLAHASSETSDIIMKPVRIDDIIWQARADVIKANPSYRINIEFIKTPEAEDSVTLKGNEHFLLSAVKNLMENGCKFSPKGQVKVELDFDPNNIIMHFIDKGIGIDKEEQENIFIPFYRSSKTSGISGHGIGLSLVDRIVRVHDGNIIVKSEIGKGTIFTISLPK